MADDIASLSIRIDSRQVVKADTDLDKFTESADKAEKSTGEFAKTSKKAETATGAFDSTLKIATTALKGYSAALVAIKLKDAADEYVNIQNSIRQVTDSTTELTAVTNTLFQVSEDTRSNISATSSLYQKLALSTDNLGLSQAETIRLTSTINKSFALSGSTAQEAAGAIRQLGQGLASGALRGDEFNSVAEQAPIIMRAIAAETNKSIGELREFAATGGITAEIVVNALRNASDEIDQSFSESLVTFDQSMEQISNRFIKFAGENEDLKVILSAVGEVLSIAADAGILLLDGLLQAGRGVIEIIKLFGDLIMSSETLSGAIRGIAEFSTDLANNWETGLLQAIGAVAEGFIILAESITLPFYTAFSALRTIILDTVDTILDVAIAVGKFAGVSDETIAKLKLMQSNTESVQSQVDKFSDSFSNARGSIQDFVKSSVDAIEVGRKNESLMIDMSEAATGAAKSTDTLKAAVDSVVKSYKEELLLLGMTKEEQEIYNALKKAGVAANTAYGKEIAKVVKELFKEKKELEKTKMLMGVVEDAVKDLAKETAEYQKELKAVIAIADPASAKIEKVKDQIELLYKAFQKGDIKEADFIKFSKTLGDSLIKDASSVGSEFVNEFTSGADGIADSIADALISGDWTSVGDAIGGALAGSVSRSLSTAITESLSKNLTGNSGVLSQIGAAFAGPIAGAVAGAAISVVINEIEDYFSDDFNIAEERQASLGTGTILGSINEKSASIAKATEYSASAANDLVGINRDMLRALNELNVGISKATARVIRGASGVNIQSPTTQTVGQQLGEFGGILINNPLLGLIGDVGDFFGKAIDTYVDVLSDVLTLGLVDLGKLLGGKSKLKDEGIQIVGGYLSDLIDETIVNAYRTFRVKKNALDDYDTKEVAVRVGGEVERQLALVFAGIFDSVTAATDALGLDVTAALESFEIDTTRISLKGLDAEGQQAALEAYFSSVFDNLAGSVVPFLEEFQRAGEGLGETLARIATTVQTADEVIGALGVQFVGLTSEGLKPALQFLPGFQQIAEQMTIIANIEAKERLIELAGGIENFISSSANFIRNFMSESEQFEMNADALSRALGDLGLPETRDGFLALLQAQNAATESGAENIATILRLQGAADQYYDYLEKLESDRLEELNRIEQEAAAIANNEISLRIRLANALGDSEEALRLTRERELASVSESERALLEQIYAAEDAAKAIGDVTGALADLASITASSDSALSVLTKSISAEKSSIKATFDAAVQARKDEANTAIQAIKDQGEQRVAAIKAEEDARLKATSIMLDAAKEGLQAISFELRGISSALERLSDFNPNETRREDAISLLKQAVISGDLTGVGAAASTAANIRAEDFSSAIDFRRQVGLTRGLLTQLEEQGLTQESEAQRVVDTLTAQLVVIRESAKAGIEATKAATDLAIKAERASLDEELAFLQSQYDAEIERLDGLLEDAQNQLDALRGIDNSIKSVDESLQSFLEALMAEREARIEDGQTVPAFAVGGLHSGGARIVGENGPELEFTGPSRIISNRDFMEAMTNNKLSQEIAALRTEMNQAMFAIARNTLNTYKQLDEWDGNGIPGTRVGAVVTTEAV